MRTARAQRRVLMGAAIALTVAGTTGVALAPALLTYSPLLLIALSPLPRHLLLVAPITPLVGFVIVASMRSALAAVIAYGLGASYGDAGVQWARTRYPRLARFINWLERTFLRLGPLALVIAPGPMFSALAGASHMRLSTYLSIQLGAQIGWAIIMHRIGQALSQWIAPILTFFREHVVETTLLCVVALLIYRLVRSRSRKAEVLASLEMAPAPADGSMEGPER
jgi:membrane protein DedA with SNARE-associated domain